MKKSGGSGYTTREAAFLRLQGRRRLQMHFLLGLAGFCMLAGIYIPPQNHLTTWSLFWLLSIIFICWAMLLALVDYVSIRLFFGVTSQKADIERMRLEFELRRALEEKKANQKEEENKEETDDTP